MAVVVRVHRLTLASGQAAGGLLLPPPPRPSRQRLASVQPQLR